MSGKHTKLNITDRSLEQLILMGAHCTCEDKLAYRDCLRKLGVHCLEDSRQHILEVSVPDAAALEANSEVYAALSAGGISVLRVTGLYGSLSPDWASLHAFAERYGITLDICPTDELHTACALAIDAYAAGVRSITVSFCGIGGYAPLEEVVASLYVLHNVTLAEDYTALRQLTTLYEKMTGQPVSRMKPVIGADIFNYESGIHADGISKNPSMYEPFPPALVGMERKLIIGKHSGRKSLCCKLDELGLCYDDTLIEQLLNRVKTASTDLGRSLTDSELCMLHKCCRAEI